MGRVRKYLIFRCRYSPALYSPHHLHALLDFVNGPVGGQVKPNHDVLVSPTRKAVVQINVHSFGG